MSGADLLSAEMATRFATLALGHVEREYPNKLDHVINAPRDLRSPRELHPVFYGSFDWHSCVHGYWLLATIERRFPALPVAGDIRVLFDRRLTPEAIAGEVAYLAEPMRGTFERPYGWAWLLMLAAELGRGNRTQWYSALQPLTNAFVARFTQFLPKATYPIRAGTHFNTAFAVTLALEYADMVGDVTLGALLREHAVRWYSRDIDCQAWEPGGDDFLSPALVEAECMRSVVSAADFSQWLEGFLPRLAAREPAALFKPATISDRSDGKIAHLDGVNLSRAWCWRSIAGAMGPADPRRAIALEAAKTHLHASLPHLDDDYMGGHWLASFALLALR